MPRAGQVVADGEARLAGTDDERVERCARRRLRCGPVSGGVGGGVHGGCSSVEGRVLGCRCRSRYERPRLGRAGEIAGMSPDCHRGRHPFDAA